MTQQRSDNASDLFSRLSSGLGKEKKQRSLPPVDQWTPPYCGKIDIQIRKDGSWWHEGTKIGRPALVKLFSTILRKDHDGVTYLVTPVEKVAIEVEDTHFIVTRLDVITHPKATAPLLKFITNVDDVVIANKEHPLSLEIDPVTSEPKPLLKIRGNLMARLSRPVFYQLVDLSEQTAHPNDEQILFVRSGEDIFELGSCS